AARGANAMAAGGVANAMTNVSFARATARRSGGVASASTAAATVMKPRDSRTSSQRAARCARTIALMFNTPFRGVDRLVVKAARSGILTELAIRRALLRPG